LNHFGGGEGENDVYPIPIDSSNYSKWNFIKQSDDSYVIQNIGTGKYIEVSPNNASRIICKSTTITNDSKWKWKLTKFDLDLVLLVV
jgi:prefoldin subunit 5